MRKTRKNVTDHSSDESDTSNSDNIVGNTRIANKKKPVPKKKRGRPPNKKRQRLQDSSDDNSSPQPSTSRNSIADQSDDEPDSSDSDVCQAVANINVAPKRGPGRPPNANKKKLKQQNGFSRNSSPQPSTSRNSNADQSDDEPDSSDSDVCQAVANINIAPKRGPGRPPNANKKKLKQQNGFSRGSSPQPSTSQRVSDQDNQQDSENDSSSESVDSDFGPVNDRSFVKKKNPTTKKKPAKTATFKNKSNSSINGGRSQRSSLNSSQSQKKGAKSSLSNDVILDQKQIDNLAQKLVYFLLIEDQKKYAIRRKAIVTHVFKDSLYSPKLYFSVMKKANVILKKIYGMELMDLENQKDSYIIVNILRHELGIHNYVDLPRIKQQQNGLILFLLTVIYMNENVITEEELTKCLRPVGIDLTSRNLHPVFGDVKKYITTELVKQMYLHIECINKETQKYEYTWGVRANQEFDKSDLLDFVCKIMDDTQPEDWRIQFKDAESSAKLSTVNCVNI